MTRSLLVLAGIFTLAAAALAATPGSAPAPSATATKPADGQLSTVGRLATGVMAVGGETTGITVTTPEKFVYELDIKDPKLKALAESLNGKDVKVTGLLTLKTGVEVPQRRVVTVTALEAAPATAPATAK